MPYHVWLRTLLRSTPTLRVGRCRRGARPRARPRPIIMQNLKAYAGSAGHGGLGLRLPGQRPTVTVTVCHRAGRPRSRPGCPSSSRCRDRRLPASSRTPAGHRALARSPDSDGRRGPGSVTVMMFKWSHWHPRSPGPAAEPEPRTIATDSESAPPFIAPHAAAAAPGDDFDPGPPAGRDPGPRAGGRGPSLRA